MGFFSWNCRGCEHPLLSRWATDGANAWMQQAVVVEAEGRVLEGEYDGYGRVGDWPLRYGPWTDDNACLNNPGCWHRACWDKAGNPADYSPSTMSDDQGFFFDPGDHDMKEPT